MNICILGASGSIGTQTLEVISENKTNFTLVSFSVGHNDECIDKIIKNHPSVTHVFLLDKSKCESLSNKYKNIKFLCDDGDLSNIITLSNPDMVVNALVGFAGLLPSIRTLKENRKLALANKESLIIGGEIINKMLKKKMGVLYPIDSEHSAIWKCLKVDDKNVDKLVITGSGGAFRDLKRSELTTVSKNDALKHPTWNMGSKITIDSATMMNKGFELIEAHYLFGYSSDKMMVKLHSESMLHSAVLYKNGLYRGEINPPSMKNPIKFAVFEGNIEFETQTFNSFDELENLHFKDFDPIRYPLVSVARSVIEKKGNLGAIVNAANEVAVRAFLNEQISFLDIEKVIYECIKKIPYEKVKTVDDLVRANNETVKVANEIVEGLKK